MTGKTAGSAVIWSSDVFSSYYVYPKDQTLTTAQKAWWGTGTNNPKRQIGIHSFGCGDTEYDDNYYLDDPETQAELDMLESEEPVFEYPEPGRPIAREPLFENIEDYVEGEPYVKMTFMTPDEEKVEQVFTREEYLAWYDAYEEAYEAYDTAYEEWEQSIEDFISSPEVRAKRQAHVAELILEEEALEGIFEGQRFYDIMRFQMQEKGGAALGSTITMPQYVEEKYGATTKMVGKPWFLTLPTR